MQKEKNSAKTSSACISKSAPKYSHFLNKSKITVPTAVHHSPATDKSLINIANSRGIMEKEDLRRLVSLQQWDRVNTTVRNNVLLGPCRQYQSTFLCGFVQIGLKYLKKLIYNRFSWQKHLQADTLQLQNPYLHAFFPWYFKQLNWPVGTNYYSAHWEPSFARASIYKSLNLSVSQHIFNAVKAVQIQANLLIQFQIFQFGTTEIQLQIKPLTCIQRHGGTDRESGFPHPCFVNMVSEKTEAIYSRFYTSCPYFQDTQTHVFKSQTL